jgi:hypothetical protein
MQNFSNNLNKKLKKDAFCINFKLSLSFQHFKDYSSTNIIDLAKCFRLTTAMSCSNIEIRVKLQGNHVLITTDSYYHLSPSANYNTIRKAVYAIYFDIYNAICRGMFYVTI